MVKEPPLAVMVFVRFELGPSSKMVALLVKLTPPWIERMAFLKIFHVPPVSVLVPALNWLALARFRVPDLGSTVPALLNAKLTSVLPAPADLRKVPVPRLLKIGVPETA